MRVALLCCTALMSVAFAGTKQYPLQGTVTALGTQQEVVNTGSTLLTMFHRTYTVRTPNEVFVLECPYWMNGFHVHSPNECSGKKKIEIGNTVYFRVKKEYAYMQTDAGKEQKLNILSESMKGEATPEPAKP